MKGVRARGADFSRSYLGEADLSLGDFSGAVLKLVRMPKAICRGTRFAKADCSNCDMSHADLTKADFEQANLFMATLHGAVQEKTRFTGANKALLRGVDKELEAAENWKPRPNETKGG